MSIATNSILLKASKRLRCTIKIMICLNVAFALVFLKENMNVSQEIPLDWVGLTVKSFTFLLILAVAFLCFLYNRSLPNNEESVDEYKQSHHSIPIALFILLFVQIAIIASTYMLADMGWHTFESFRLIYFISPPLYSAILIFFLQIAIVINGVYIFSRTFKLRLLSQNHRDKELLIGNQLNRYDLYLKVTCVVAIFSTVLYLAYNIYTEVTMFQYFDFVLINPISFKEIFFILNLIIPIVLSIAIGQKFHINEPLKLKRLYKRITLLISMNLVYYFIVSIPKELALNRYLPLLIAVAAVVAQAMILYLAYRVQVVREIFDLQNELED